ncbi:thioredoxin family protein [Photobacterium sp. DNB23_23_1]|uniref:Thioredoxin family protein n=1 Tax=Photobacterium pectinilyticum TaxID=2906793 RepID=A0ABT1MVX0_9GAMM|nr:thioredoxin family protein [Photobacterium sp. ZSDE20]MCQ1056643.1 thioredoxin family protein [Photobacterium sp. ZSDE20]MDD1820779.1 thioredoxin family protein [Photobacterium sp. ZSDE20]
MKTIQVYGPGCNNCAVTAERFAKVAKDLGQDVVVEKISSLEDIMKAGVMSTPGVGVNGIIQHTGSVPTEEQVRAMLA